MHHTKVIAKNVSIIINSDKNKERKSKTLPENSDTLLNLPRDEPDAPNRYNISATFLFIPPAYNYWAKNNQ